MIRPVMRSARGLGLAGAVLALWLSGCSAIQQSLAVDPFSIVPPTKTSGMLSSLSRVSPQSSLSQTTYDPQKDLSMTIPQPPKVSQTGLASWYGPRFHGKRTANGEKYNKHALTAAHKTLPLGSRAIVTNLNTGQSIEVRINDRGPFIEGRVIDLSQTAARLVGVLGPGVAPVKVEVVSPDGQPIAQTMVPPSAYAVLVASSTDEAEAIAVMNEVSQRYDDAYLSPLSSGALRYYQVRLGPFPSLDEAARRAREVAHSGMQALVVGEADRRVER
jgi:peptidoglycan lytic transglycosylase